jgi:hypothetical protein
MWQIFRCMIRAPRFSETLCFVEPSLCGQHVPVEKESVTGIATFLRFAFSNVKTILLGLLVCTSLWALGAIVTTAFGCKADLVIT